MSTTPNLLFIMTDQHRFDAMGANGHRLIQTPNLDSLACSGANLQNYFVNAPVCVPSRCTLFTGRYPHSHRCRENYNHLEAGREMHLFRVLKHAGYRIGYCGKNHLLDQQEFVNFDFVDYVSDLGHKPEAAEAALRQQYKENASRFPRSEIWRFGLVHDAPPQATRTWQTAEAGRRFLQQQTGDKPFALCVSFEDPHVPHMALREYFKKYPLDAIDLYPCREGELEEKARRWAIKYGAFNAADASEEDKKRYIAIYYAMISWVDTQIGRLRQTLRERGLEENTLIVYTSDHGEFAFEHGLAKKDLVLIDSLLRVPCIFTWPGKIKSQVITDTLMEEVDIMPTILDFLGVKIPFGIQGQSFAAVLNGERKQHKDASYAEICPPYLYNKYPDFDAFAAAHGGKGNTPFNVPGDFNKSIREKHWRYTWYGDGQEELYDLRRDPHEQYNRAGESAYATEKLRLKLRLLEWNALSEDPIDPNGLRDLQNEYSHWSPLSVQPGMHYSPQWVEMRYKPMPRKVF